MYHFHVWSQRGETIRDDVGVLLPGPTAVAVEAAALAKRYADAAAIGGPDYAACWFEVAEADGRQFFTIPAFGRI